MSIKLFQPNADNSLGLNRDIKAQFGSLTAPYRLSDYYRSGRWVPNILDNTNIPLSGQIRFSDFFGTRTFQEVPVEDFPNGDFETGSISPWDTLNQQIKLNGGTTILGWPTPTDPTPRPTNSSGQQSPGDIVTVPSSVFSSTIINDNGPSDSGTKALRLSSGTFTGPSSSAGFILYGPAVYSTSPVIAYEGDTLQFDWRAESGTVASAGDAFNVFGYLLNPNTGQTIIVLDVNANSLGFQTSWQTVSRTFQSNEAGPWHYIFIAGSFDATFGLVIGSSLVIDNVDLIEGPNRFE